MIVATEGPAAAAMLPQLRNLPVRPGAPVGTTCLYFAIDGPPPLSAPILYLNGDGGGMINNCCFPSTVASTYARRRASRSRPSPSSASRAASGTMSWWRRCDRSSRRGSGTGARDGTGKARR